MFRDLNRVNPDLLRSILPLYLPPLDTHSLTSPHSFIATTNSSELVLGPCPANSDIAERALTHALMCAIDSVAPLRKAILSSRRKPWVNPQIRALMKSRDRAYRLARSSGSAADLTRFRLLRAQASNALDTAKNKHVACRLAEAPSAEGKWRELRRLHVSSPSLLLLLHRQPPSPNN